jgi:HD-GYP domain-containing protein (c-di-GMP phosphodiesterase class II)
VDKALEIMEQGRGSHFDAKVLDAFLGVIDDVAAVSRESDGTLAQSRTEDLLRRYFRVGAPPA